MIARFLKYIFKHRFHQWYHGNFTYPVYGRYERHCLICDEKQYSQWQGKKHNWISFEYPPIPMDSVPDKASSTTAATTEL